MKYRRDWDLSKRGGMKPRDKEFIKKSVVVGEYIEVERRTSNRIIKEKIKVVAKFTHHFLGINDRGYKDSYMYIDLYCSPEEV